MVDLEDALRHRFAQVQEPALVPASDLLPRIRRQHARRQALLPAGIAALGIGAVAVAVPLLRSTPATRMQVAATPASSASPVDPRAVVLAGLTFHTPVGLVIDMPARRNAWAASDGSEAQATSSVHLTAANAPTPAPRTVLPAGPVELNRVTPPPRSLSIIVYESGPMPSVVSPFKDGDTSVTIAGLPAKAATWTGSNDAPASIPGSYEQDGLLVSLRDGRTVAVNSNGVGMTAIVQMVEAAVTGS